MEHLEERTLLAADLAPSTFDNLAPSFTFHPGDTVPTQWRVTNFGDTTTTSQFDTAFSLSTQPNFSGVTRLLKTWSTGSGIGPNGSTSLVQDSLILPPADDSIWASGSGTSFYLLMSVDTKNQVFESNENNNVFAQFVAVQPPVDLSVSYITTDATAIKAGDSFGINWRFFASGITTPLNFSQDFVLSRADGSFATLLKRTPYTNYNYVSSTFTNDFIDLPPAGSPVWNGTGTYQLTMYLDSLGQVTEGNETNNAITMFLTITAGTAGNHAATLDGSTTDSIIGRAGGSWWVAKSTGAAFQNQLWGSWNGDISWQDVQLADVNGDGKLDVVGRVADTGAWYVGYSTGTSLNTQFLAAWSPSVKWQSVLSGDVDGDGKADLLGRANGQWWVLHSTPNGYQSQLWASWLSTVTFQDVQLGDFNGDGKLDVIGRNNGGLWVGLSTGTSFNTTQWGSLPYNAFQVWSDVLVADVNGDGKDDLVGRASDGTWYVARSTGTAFSVEVWGKWSSDFLWENVFVGDVDGSGRDSIVGRGTGQWWVARSTGTSFVMQQFGQWTTAAAWENVQPADVNGDGKIDIVGRVYGQWWVGLSTGNSFFNQLWGGWSGQVDWQNVQTTRSQGGDVFNDNNPSGYTPGSVTLVVLDQLGLGYDRAITEAQQIAQASRGTVSSTTLINSLTTLKAQLASLRTLLQPVSAGTTARLSVTPATWVDRDQLELLDRWFADYFRTFPQSRTLNAATDGALAAVTLPPGAQFETSAEIDQAFKQTIQNAVQPIYDSYNEAVKTVNSMAQKAIKTLGPLAAPLAPAVMITNFNSLAVDFARINLGQGAQVALPKLQQFEDWMKKQFVSRAVEEVNQIGQTLINKTLGQAPALTQQIYNIGQQITTTANALIDWYDEVEANVATIAANLGGSTGMQNFSNTTWTGTVHWKISVNGQIRTTDEPMTLKITTWNLNTFNASGTLTLKVPSYDGNGNVTSVSNRNGTFSGSFNTGEFFTGTAVISGSSTPMNFTIVGVNNDQITGEFPGTGGALGVPFDLTRSAINSGSPGTGEGEILQAADLPAMVDAAIARWAAAGLSPIQIASLQSIQYQVVSLPGSELGAELPGTIYLDDDAAGSGWFIDTTPLGDEEFTRSTLLAIRGKQADAKMDLLTVIMHEMGHALGLEHNANPDDLMFDSLTVGRRRLPTAADLAAVDSAFAAD